jgi:hypothetical protein
MANKQKWPVDTATQAGRVIKRFGSAYRLAKITGLSFTTVYRWCYPRSAGGSDGVIPRTALPRVLAAATQNGIVLSAEDLDPRPSYLD